MVSPKSVHTKKYEQRRVYLGVYMYTHILYTQIDTITVEKLSHEFEDEWEVDRGGLGRKKGKI